jgi:hypothetical protein
MTVENMRFAKKSLVFAVGATLASIMTACGSGNGTVLPANIRVANLTPLTSTNSTLDTVTLTLNSTTYAVAAAPSAASGYVAVDPGTYVGAVESNDPTVSAFTFPGLGLGTNQYYSILAYPREGTLYPFELIDNVVVPAVGQAQLTVANASPDAGPLDVYMFQHSSASPADPCTNTLTNATFPGLQGQQSSPLPFPVLDANNNPITYDVCVTAASTPTDPRLSIGGANTLSMHSTGIYALALTSGAGGTLVNGAVIVQGPGGTVTTIANPNFRVRLLVALGSASPAPAVTVTTSLGTTTLPNVYSGNASNYQALSFGATSVQPTVAVTVAGTSVPVTLPAGFAFSTGADYTILVYGSAPLAATVLVDDNHYIASKASVRLVNAADPGVGLTMYVNGHPEAEDITLGTASTYYAVNTGTDTITLRSSDLSAGVGAATPETTDLIVGGVYTVFLFDPTQAPIVFEDR